jgi:uncharacterized protein (DUF169 family)
MDLEVKEKCMQFCADYLGGAELPLACYYADDPIAVKVIEPPSGHRCIFADLSKVRRGTSVCFDSNSFGCFGGKRYLGFGQDLTPNFEYFLSCGIPGKLEGERYKKTPELVKEIMAKVPNYEAPGKFIVFKRWDMLEVSDEPDVVIFFARPDVLSGLFTLANFDVGELNGVYSPFSAGCGSIVQYPYIEKESDHPKAVLGMFDVSARPYVPDDVLSLSLPMKKFVAMLNNIKESFLITGSWNKVRTRIKKTEH